MSDIAAMDIYDETLKYIKKIGMLYGDKYIPPYLASIGAHVGNLKNNTILDLYCGMGNFSIPAALQGAAVTGIELNRESISRAKHNAEICGITCRFYTADVADTLRNLCRRNEQVHTIIIDPPRRGLGKTARLLPKLQPKRIIYISCDPATLARDLAMICGREYSLVQLTPVDMFPQTHHIESVALLEKN